MGLLLGLAPFVFILALVVILLRQAQGGRGLLEFGRKARPVKRPTVTFDDVAGLPEAVEELTEIRDFLVDPARFAACRRADPEGRAALRSARHRQDVARARGRR